MISQVRNRARGVTRRIRHLPSIPAAEAAPAAAPVVEHRHPAMRGINVSPVHGHHCNCSRCETGSRAA